MDTFYSSRFLWSVDTTASRLGPLRPNTTIALSVSWQSQGVRLRVQ